MCRGSLLLAWEETSGGAAHRRRMGGHTLAGTGLEPAADPRGQWGGLALMLGTLSPLWEGLILWCPQPTCSRHPLEGPTLSLFVISAVERC